MFVINESTMTTRPYVPSALTFEITAFWADGFRKILRINSTITPNNNQQINFVTEMQRVLRGTNLLFMYYVMHHASKS